MGQDQAGSISSDKIVALNAKLAETGKSTSSARKKLAIRRAIREAEALIKEHSSAPNRFEVWSILYRSQQVLVGLLSNADQTAILYAARTIELLADPSMRQPMQKLADQFAEEPGDMAWFIRFSTSGYLSRVK